jgi:hypothetical protein
VIPAGAEQRHLSDAAVQHVVDDAAGSDASGAWQGGQIIREVSEKQLNSELSRLNFPEAVIA